MTEQEKALVRKHFEFQMELFKAQGDEIERLKASLANLARMHALLEAMMQITQALIRRPGVRASTRKV
jgi:arsenate reductase-like glutaredoxin family protein